jgi:hypothetical protein
MSMSHLVLLGDSVFDNAAYVSGRPAVIDQVRSRLPAGWRATLAARDGSVIADVQHQLEGLPQGASHLVLSAGGNDLLHEIGILQEPVATVGAGLRLLADVRNRFQEDYRGLLDAVAGRSRNTVVCTIYNPASPDEALQRETVAALGLFNDAIIGVAREFGMPVIDLRAVCTKVADFVNAIEPSSAGGAKIAEAVCDLVTRHDFGTRRTVLVP